MSITIRQATPDDATAIYDMIYELAVYEKAPQEVVTTPEEIRETLFASGSKTEALICEVAGKAVGYAVFFTSYSTWLGRNGIYMEDLYVTPDYRGIGAGKALLKTIAQYAVQRQCGRLEWSVLDWNQPAIDFLYATGATASTHNPEVNFTDDTAAGGKDCSFHHRMSQITLTFEAGSGVDFNTIKPTGYTLSGLVLEGSFDTTTGTAETDANAQTADLTMELDGALTSSVILFPQSTTSIELSVNYNGQPYTATLTIPEGALKAGNNYTYTVTVRNKDLSVSSATISDWKRVNGGNVNADL